MRRPTKAAGSLLALVLAAACAGDGRDAAEADASATASGGGTSGVAESGGAALRDGAQAQIDAAVAGLVEDAARTRAELDFGALPPWSARAGADPWALLQDGGRTLGLTRRGAVVVLDEDARVLRRVPTVVGASAIVRVGGELVIASETTGELDVLDGETLASRRRIELPGVASIRAIAWGAAEGRIYVADPHRHRVLATPWPVAVGETPEAAPVGACNGALGLARVGEWLVVDCLLDHRVTARRVTADGSLGPAAIIEHDGPIWSFDAVVRDDGTLALVLGGVEDRPLDRTDGAFGWIDSFVFVYEVQSTGAQTAPIAHERHVLNVSEHGVITPKRVRWSNPAATQAMITSYGSDVALEVAWPSDGAASPRVEAQRVAPGITDFTGTLEQGIFASPLLDAWIVTRPGEAPRVVAVPDPTDDRTPSERLGEALAFTGLMAPRAISEGRRSRFTCETCHFEGTTDGRIHWTGREDVHATTKTLRGLFNNRPHFSRALDRTTAGMVHAEFRVANRGTEQDPWFSIDRADVEWLDALGAPAGPLDPVTLRRALVDFLAAFTPESNPAVRGLQAFTPEQGEGARLFARHCESCHRARLVADDPGSVVPFERWPELVLHGSGGIVWGSEARHRTGVMPYVHAEGARVPSLRRLHVKRPLLTNGSATTPDAVLDAVRLAVPEVHGGGSGVPLEAAEKQALAAFLELL
jgi:mono/diheme cytochrome c family protein